MAVLARGLLPRAHFASIAPRIDTLDAGRCVVSFRHRRAVTNHLGTVHAIALCNAAELAAGLAMAAALSRTSRWIPKGMHVDYLRKATGRMTAVATVDDVPQSDSGREVAVRVEVTDPRGDAVCRAVVSMWVSSRPAR